MPSPPRAFCLRCRALLDEAQDCDCDDRGARVTLDGDAKKRIAEALLRVPHVDVGESTQRFLMSLIVGPGLLAAIFGLIALVLLGIGADGGLVGLTLGVPLALLTAAWCAFFAHSELEARRPYYPGARERQPLREPVVEATLEAGRVAVVELRQDSDAPVVIRDALIEEDLELRMPGKRVIVPAGRCEVEVDATRLRHAPPSDPIAETWEQLPDELKRAGRLRRTRLERGVRVELLDGELEDLPERETTFREAVEDRVRFKPNGGRVRLRVVG